MPKSDLRDAVQHRVMANNVSRRLQLIPEKANGGQRPNLVLLQRHHTLGNQAVRVLFQHVLLPTDQLVHEGLREHGLIYLVVAEPPVANLQIFSVLALRFY